MPLTGCFQLVRLDSACLPQLNLFSVSPRYPVFWGPVCYNHHQSKSSPDHLQEVGQTNAQHYLAGDWALHPWKNQTIRHDGQSLHWSRAEAVKGDLTPLGSNIDNPLCSTCFFSAHEVYPNWDFVGCNDLHCEQIVCACVCFNKLCRGNTSRQNLCSPHIAVLSNSASCYIPPISFFFTFFPSLCVAVKYFSSLHLIWNYSP